MNDGKNSLLKSTALLGSTQVIKIVLGVISTKLTAIFLGPAGVGLVGLINNTINLITTSSGFGIEFSGVREISLARKTNDLKILSRKVVILKRLMLFSASLAAIIMIILSSKLSVWTFRDEKHGLWFVGLSLIFVFNALRSYYNVVLQGIQELKLLATSWLYASFFTTLFSGIIYYFLRYDGILLVFLTTSIINMIAGYYCFRNIKTNYVHVSFDDFKKESIDFIKLGVTFSVNSFVSLLGFYFIRMYISKTSSISTLGFYEAGITFSTYYVSFIFTAMTADFYPRLTSVCDEIKKVNEMVNKQIALTILIVTPAVVILYASAPLLVKLLFSKNFSPVVDILIGISFSMVLKSISWPLAYIVLAKGDRKTFFFQELFADSMNVVLTIILFKKFGLVGIGIAQISMYVAYGLYIYVVVKNNYNFSFEGYVKKIILYNLGLSGSCAVFVYIFNYPYTYFFSVLILVFSISYSYICLTKYFGLKIPFNIIKK